ncbi:agmatine deiminase family protein [Alkalibacter rhizosphaerae]|uniref:Agmatine deiminase family protein n=1 Tax=Alkalibacter rhizosphaerae TaxID=2815577 RepID=A0A974XGE3_9FIRM|nr:agmatine deiminase family protein [Alkalibacter rhizosphaerae]QSX09377.1 agmatine deiminase family protein [Alkalibacter rhizosphaerae]
MFERRMPAEWETHEKTILQWPVADSLVHPDNYTEVCDGYEETIRAIQAFEPVGLIVDPEEMGALRKRLGEDIDLYPIPHNDAWARDSVPTIIVDKDGSRLGVDWKFNAWGEKYQPYDLDDALGEKILAMTDIARERPDLVLEGGSIHSDGEGTILTTKECLLNPNRNPGMSMEAIEEALKDHLGAKKVIWLEEGLDGDETDGHIDNIACFAAPGKVLLQVCRDPKDPNYAITRRCLEVLDREVDARGRRLEVVEIEQPPYATYRGKRATLSYLNFYFVNDGLILPVFGGDAAQTDQKAMEVLKDAFPQRGIATVNGWSLVKEGGNVHCITQQIPKAAKEERA